MSWLVSWSAGRGKKLPLSESTTLSLMTIVMLSDDSECDLYLYNKEPKVSCVLIINQETVQVAVVCLCRQDNHSQQQQMVLSIVTFSNVGIGAPGHLILIIHSLIDGNAEASYTLFPSLTRLGLPRAVAARFY